ncbi:MAG: hypothetical protein H0W27_03890 [Actinobacteria bacterium]|nr:hypothetical protein [Actinomycetota bacterium]
MNAPRLASRLSPGFIAAGLVALVAALLLAWLFPLKNARTLGTHFFDAPVYASFEALAAASDAVVVGTVGGVTAREVDYGTDNPAEQGWNGIPVAFYEVDVTEVLVGQAQPTIIVGGPDGEQLVSDSATPMRAGERVLLFLREQTTEDAPGISSYDFFYTPISLDNGVFDLLAGEAVQPRMPEVFAETAAGAEVGDAPTFKLSEIRARVSGG